jgi:hypothetical protein
MRSKSWIHEAHGGIRDKNELKNDITLDPAG